MNHKTGYTHPEDGEIVCSGASLALPSYQKTTPQKQKPLRTLAVVSIYNWSDEIPVGIYSGQLKIRIEDMV